MRSEEAINSIDGCHYMSLICRVFYAIVCIVQSKCLPTQDEYYILSRLLYYIMITESIPYTLLQISNAQNVYIHLFIYRLLSLQFSDTVLLDNINYNSLIYPAESLWFACILNLPLKKWKSQRDIIESDFWSIGPIFVLGYKDNWTVILI